MSVSRRVCRRNAWTESSSQGTNSGDIGVGGGSFVFKAKVFDIYLKAIAYLKGLWPSPVIASSGKLVRLK